MRKVVVTGLGCVSPIGNSVEETWASIRAGKSGIATITHYDASAFKVKYAAEVKNFEADKYMDPQSARKMARFSKYAVAAAKMALDDSNLTDNKEALDNAAVYLGVGIGGLEITESSMKSYFDSGFKRMPPMTIPQLIPNEAAANISIKFGLHGVAHTIATACASGSDALGQALDNIRAGRSDIVLAGGAESTQNGFANLGFTVLQALSSKWADDPSKACRPFDKQRDGFVMGEGATILVLEEYEHAKARGAKIYAEFAGYGATCDGYHLTAPNPDGIMGARAMTLAMKDAGVKPEDVTYYNAHGTSTHHGDIAETTATARVFGRKVPISSTKSYIGHTLGACGAVEAWLTINMMNEGWFHPTLNLKNIDPECGDLDYIKDEGRKIDAEYVMSNNFAFAGINTSLIFKKWSE